MGKGSRQKGNQRGSKPRQKYTNLTSCSSIARTPLMSLTAACAYLLVRGADEGLSTISSNRLACFDHASCFSLSPLRHISRCC